MKLTFKSLGTLPLYRFLSTVPKLLNLVQEAALEEHCILVDKHDQECGFASKRDCHRLRSSTKITFPDHYTNSCCSHPLYEIEHERKDLEGAKAAACRRLVFELGIPTNQCHPKDLQYITRIRLHIIMKLTFKSLGTLPLYRFLSTVPKLLNLVQEAALEEHCILVDKHDQECGFASKRDCHRLRSSTKITFPDHYTNSCCSHPLYEIEHERKDLEGAKAAACRRLVFELGIPTNQCHPKDLQYITRIRYMSKGVKPGVNTKLITYLFCTKMFLWTPQSR
ncbi:hypothetical protein ACI65C_005532 [Semiaphis heraclei]